MRARLLAFVVWAAVAASAMFWILRVVGVGAGAPAHATSVAATDVPRGDWARLFPVAPPPTAAAPAMQDAAAAARFQLVGVAAPFWASISVDGKPPRSLAQGASVDGAWVVQTIAAKEVAIGPPGQAPVFTLPLAGLPPPSTGTLPTAVNESFGSAAPPPNVAPPTQMVPPDTAAPGAVIPPPPRPIPGGVEVNLDPNAQPQPGIPALKR